MGPFRELDAVSRGHLALRLDARSSPRTPGLRLARAKAARLRGMLFRMAHSRPVRPGAWGWEGSSCFCLGLCWGALGRLAHLAGLLSPPGLLLPNAPFAGVGSSPPGPDAGAPQSLSASLKHLTHSLLLRTGSIHGLPVTLAPHTSPSNLSKDIYQAASSQAAAFPAPPQARVSGPRSPPCPIYSNFMSHHFSEMTPQLCVTDPSAWSPKPTMLPSAAPARSGAPHQVCLLPPLFSPL